MKPQDKTSWISTQYLRAGLAISEIAAAKKQKVAGYDERLRMLNTLTDRLLIKQIDAQDELFDPKEILSPELVKLLEAPLHGLD
jgi:hypothetical protein